MSKVLKTLCSSLLREWDMTATSYTGECNTQEPQCSKDLNQWLKEFKQRPYTFEVNSHSECTQENLSQTKKGPYKFTNVINKKFCQLMLTETKLGIHIIPQELWNLGLMSE